MDLSPIPKESPDELYSISAPSLRFGTQWVKLCFQFQLQGRSKTRTCPMPLCSGYEVDTSVAAVDHLTSSVETCDLITPVQLQESQGLCAHGNETEMGLKIPVCPGLSNTQCLSDIGLHSGNPVDPCGTFMGVEAFGLDSWICLRIQTHISSFFSNCYHCTLSTSYTR